MADDDGMRLTRGSRGRTRVREIAARRTTSTNEGRHHRGWLKLEGARARA